MGSESAGLCRSCASPPSLHTTQNQTVHLRVGLGPSQNPLWDLNTPGWDTNLAKTHSLLTEITDLVSRPNEGQVLDVSLQKESSERQSDR